ncbi:MAG: YtxH domain-containing protein [Paludibacteraceae bacterium]|nr:YtxH domain-containing protein [Paludibacteraceae bacterium]
MAKSSYSVAAFLCGVIVGGVAALLLTPKTGKEMREEISNFAEEGVQKLQNVRERMRSQDNGQPNEE